MISGKNKQLYYESSIDKQLNIEVIGTGHVIDNSMREQDTFALTETLNDGTELKFGSCLPNQISFTGRDIPLATKGMKLRPVETLEGNENDPFVYGTYTVQSDTPTADRTKRQIVAYDAMYDIINSDVKSWYDGLTFPMSLKAFRDSFFVHLGIDQKETSLVNDAMTVNKTLITSTTEDSAVTAEAAISGKTIIEAICEINGAFGNINREGKFEYVILQTITSAVYPAEDLYPREDLFPSDSNAESMTGHYITFDYEDFQSKAITQLEIRADDNTAGAIVGTAGNTYVISGNFLISDKTGAELEQIANNVLPIMAQAAYTPIKSSTCVGNPCLELGDPIRFNTSREIVETYLLQRILTGVQSKRDAIVSPGTKYHTDNPNSIRDRIENIGRRTNNLERTADHTLSELADLDENTSSRFEQTANAITAEVAARQGADGQISASLELKIDKTDDGTIISLINGSANKINFTASNMFTVSAPNFSIDAAGNVQMGGQMIADTAMYLCYNYASLPGMAFATKINAMDLSGGSYVEHALSGQDILLIDSTAVGISSPILTIGRNAVLIKTDKEIQAPSVAANVGFFGDLGLSYAIGTNGGRVYKCMGSVGDNGIASPGWVKNWVDKQVPSISTLDQRYMHSYVSGGSDGSGSVFVHSMSFVNGVLTVRTASVSSSDERLKTDISDMPDIYALYMSFVPKKFKFDDRLDGYDHRWHFGLLAQDVEHSICCTGADAGGLVWREHTYDDFHESEIIGDDYVYKLDKNELHAMHIQMIQKQQREIDQLKIDNFALRGEVDILKQRLQRLEEKLC